MSEAVLGVVLVDHGSRAAESNALFERFVELFAARTEHAIVEPAHMELAEPSLEQAFARCVERGASRVYVAPYFFAPGKHWRVDLPALAAAAAATVSAAVGRELSWLVGQPLGLHEALVSVVEDRLQHCLSHADGAGESCAACADTGRCRFKTSSGSDPSL